MTLTKELFQHLKLFHEQGLQEEIIDRCELKTFGRGELIVKEGQYVRILPIVISGSLRVYQSREEREILLYFVEANETCMMSLSACFFNSESPSNAVAMEVSEILCIPSSMIVKWQKAYNSWNDFVIRTFRSRYDELLDSFESVAFHQIDKRVLTYLKARAARSKSHKIEISHQELANELGTTRVVVSRILKQLELEEIVELHRGYIKVM
jgi:CRP/FNR family transcriptional regulator